MRVIGGKRLPTVTETAIQRFFGDYRFLSNFHICDVKVRGLVFPSSEHAYLALKTVDVDERLAVQKADTPGKAKRIGQQITLREGWDALRLISMRKVALAKFRQNKDLGQKLKNTGDKLLEETNNWGDKFWE